MTTTIKPPSEQGGNTRNDAGYTDALNFARSLMRTGEIHELRVPGPGITGYFDTPEAMAAAAIAIEATIAEDVARGVYAGGRVPSGVYLTANPVNLTLAGRRLNQQPGRSKGAAGNADVIRRRNLVLDFDPLRASGHTNDASTDAERDAAVALRDQVREVLREEDWPEPAAVTMSGNGAGLIYAIDLPNDEASTAAIRALLLTLSARFSTDAVKLDVGMCDAARLTKIPGTTARKGTPTEARPWRVAELHDVNPEVEIVDLALVDTGDSGENAERTADGSTLKARGQAGEIIAALDRSGIGYREEITKTGGIQLHLDRCPTGDHSAGGATSTSILITPSGRPGFSCLHDTCKQGGSGENGKMTWKDAKAALGMNDTEGKQNPSTALHQLAVDSGVEVFHDALGDAFVSFLTRGHRETHPADSTGLRNWLRLVYAERFGKIAGGQAIADVVGQLVARAGQGDEHEVSVRVAHHPQTGRVYLDLCNPDYEVVEIDAEGWRIVCDPPVRFRRPKGMLPLPTPERGGTIADLAYFINAGSGEEGEDNFRIAVAWVLSAFHPTGPYPVLNLSGERGSAKSSTLLVLRNLIDPNVAGLRGPAKDEERLVITAMNSLFVTADNLHSLKQWMSDAFCRLATGGGLSKRSLYTNFDEALVNVRRPVGFTGIGDIGSQSDLMERSLLFKAPVLTKAGKTRLSERALEREWRRRHPALLGAMLDAVSAAVQNLPSVEGTLDLPRMADFAEWIVAAESGLGWETGSFLASYRRNQSIAEEQAVNASPIYGALLRMLRRKFPTQDAFDTAVKDEPRKAHRMTNANLLDTLRESASMGELDARGRFPNNTNALSKEMHVAAGSLRESGIDVARWAIGQKRGWEFTLLPAYWDALKEEQAAGLVEPENQFASMFRSLGMPRAAS
jgi:hypothetical protein